MIKRVRAVIVKDNQLLTIKRFKNNETYFVLPGGGVMDGETDVEALKRECWEEINVSVSVGDLIFKQEFNDNEEYFYLCEIMDGQVSPGAGEEYINMKADNYYEPVYLSLNDLDNFDLKPAKIVPEIRRFLEK